MLERLLLLLSEVLDETKWDFKKFTQDEIKISLFFYVLRQIETLRARLARTLFQGKHFHFHPSINSIVLQRKENGKGHCYSISAPYVSVIFPSRGRKPLPTRDLGAMEVVKRTPKLLKLISLKKKKTNKQNKTT